MRARLGPNGGVDRAVYRRQQPVVVREVVADVEIVGVVELVRHLERHDVATAARRKLLGVCVLAIRTTRIVWQRVETENVGA